MLNELSEKIYDIAKDKGWWDEPRSVGDIIALCHSELSEALEAYRNSENTDFIYYKCGDKLVVFENCNKNCNSCYYLKPEGLFAELIDCIIRILDFCGRHNIDVDKIINTKIKYNDTRDYRHGGKRL